MSLRSFTCLGKWCIAHAFALEIPIPSSPTKDGKVTLKGTVTNKNEKNQIEYMVKNVEGVKSVSNDVDVQK
jgi:hypothetical protein